MKQIYLSTLLVLLSISFSNAQVLCDSSGSIAIFANYDGGILNINCDVNVPNLKIGICSYEPVTVNLSGPYVSNVTEVRYAGYVSTTNYHCAGSDSTTTISGVSPGITTINYLPAATLSNPNGYGSIICGYSCDIGTSQGGCNTADQIMDYFETTMSGGTMMYYTQYGCWDTAGYSISGGGTCCSAVSGCSITVEAGPDQTICPGAAVLLSGSSVGGDSCYWSPALGLSDPLVPDPMASPATTTTYFYTCTDSIGCVETDSVTIYVSENPITFDPLDSICEGAEAVPLSASPSGGTFFGPGVISMSEFNPGVAGPGSHTLTYTYMDSVGCEYSDTASVVVIDTVDMLEAWDDGMHIHAHASGPVDTYTWIINGFAVYTTTDSFIPVDSVIPFIPGSYEVFGTRDGCRSDTFGMIIDVFDTPIGMDPNRIELLINVYPNPSSGRLMIEGIEEVTTIGLFDVLGRKIPFELQIKTDGPIELPELSEGMYTLQFQSSKGLKRKRILIH